MPSNLHAIARLATNVTGRATGAQLRAASIPTELVTMAGYALRALAEIDPANLVAGATMWDDAASEADARNVVRVRRDADAIAAFNGAAMAAVDVLPWRGSRRPFIGAEDLTRALDATGIRTLRILRSPTHDSPHTSHVRVVMDQDGIVDILKQQFDERDGPLGDSLDVEGDVLDTLHGVRGVPAMIARRIIAGETFLLREFSYGIIASALPQRGWRAAVSVGARVAATLAEVHARGVTVLDLRPDNVLANGTIFDMSHARVTRGEDVDSFIMDARYVAPETVTSRRASMASDIFALGVMLYTMTTGEHPFVTAECITSRDPESEILRYSLANAFGEYNPRGVGSCRFAVLLTGMLDRDPPARPSARDVARALRELTVEQPSGSWALGDALPPWPGPERRPLALVPARMGVPHRGHVDLCARLIDMGYHVVISLQRSFTLTPDDPLPKWIVAKILTRSILDRGYSERDFDFVYMPYTDDREMRLNFLMMPCMDRVEVIASGNPTVHSFFAPLLAGRTMLDMHALYGDQVPDVSESWGGRLREAIRAGDEAIIADLQASGTDGVITRDRLVGWLRVPMLIAHVPGLVRAVLRQDGGILCECRVETWDGPEETLRRRMGTTGTLAFEGVEFDGMNETINYRLEDG